MMKTKLLFSAMVLIGLTSATTTATAAVTQGEDLKTATRYRYAEPIMFVERGVEFMIFPDGSFDFNTNVGNSGFDNYDDNYYYRGTNTRRSSVNATQGAPGTVSRVHYATPHNGGVLIQHDFDGKVRRIGNVFINYDRVGKVKRVGTVYMSYNRGGMLTQVGGLRVTYNRWGEIVNCSGAVNPFNSHYQYGVVTGHGGQQHYNDYDDDDDYYYYKQGDKVKKQKKIKK
ncbi:MAG: hypothetical protein KDD03_09875 [Gelidibacter sp.]|nr:hypothetical protein [Gelidibacter sp.]